ncbi:hypothetical protein MRX96_039089 [Rhipicephalus microplus]
MRNRVQEFLEITSQCTWRHCPEETNPAATSVGGTDVLRENVSLNVDLLGVRLLKLHDDGRPRRLVVVRRRRRKDDDTGSRGRGRFNAATPMAYLQPTVPTATAPTAAAAALAAQENAMSSTTLTWQLMPPKTSVTASNTKTPIDWCKAANRTLERPWMDKAEIQAVTRTA